MQDLVRWPQVTGGWSLASFASAGLSHEELRCGGAGSSTQLPAAGLTGGAGREGALFEAEEEARAYLHAAATPCLNQITSR